MCCDLTATNVTIVTESLHLTSDKRTSPFRISDGRYLRITVWLGALKQPSPGFAAPITLTQFDCEHVSDGSDGSDGRMRIVSKLDFAARTTRLMSCAR
jgi:hypothetical protein